MLTRRFNGTGWDSHAAHGTEPDPSSNPFAPPAARYECQQCGAHATGLIARATHGKFCSTCGSRELVAIEEQIGPPRIGSAPR